MTAISVDIDKKEVAGIVKAFKTLPEKVAKKVNMAAARNAMTPVLKAAKSKVEKDTGDLRRAIVRKQQRKNKGFTAIAMVTVKIRAVKTTGNDEADNPGKYGAIVEFGSRRAPAKPFLRPALSENQGEVVSRYIKGMRKGIDKEVLKLKVN